MILLYHYLVFRADMPSQQYSQLDGATNILDKMPIDLPVKEKESTAKDETLVDPAEVLLPNNQEDDISTEEHYQNKNIEGDVTGNNQAKLN